MITLADLIQTQSLSLGTSETNLYTNDKRIDAINRAVESILEQYTISQYTIKTILNFTAGIATLPDDCLIPYKLADNQDTEYQQVDFDKFALNISCSYLVDYDTLTDTERLNIYPQLTVPLNFWYIQMPTPLSDDADTVKLKERMRKKAEQDLGIMAGRAEVKGSKKTETEEPINTGLPAGVTVKKKG